MVVAAFEGLDVHDTKDPRLEAGLAADPTLEQARTGPAVTPADHGPQR